jgi:hypothetical protein
MRKQQPNNGTLTARMRISKRRRTRKRLIAAVAKTDNWPINKDTLMKKHFKAFAKFTERKK